jgi:methylisocitrate lyase
MADSNGKSTALRRLIDMPEPLVVPCAYDCVSARIVELAGFPAVMHGGFNTSASLLGVPDIGIITMAETLAVARRMAEAVEIPLIGDVDDGFGKTLNVIRTTEEAISSGLAGMYIEDQVLPKRCPALGGGGVVSTEEMVRKIHAARRTASELDPDFVIIARTHASRALTFDEGIRRGIIYLKEGADMVWVDQGFNTSALEELKIIADRVGSLGHVVASMTENVGRPLLTTSELYRMGFKLITYPLTLLMTAAKAMTEVMQQLAGSGTTASVENRMMPVKEFEGIVKMGKVREIEREFEEEEK